MNKYCIFVLGATNTGKSTFLEKVKSCYPKDTYIIQVGKIFRAKYPPSYFEGQAAPEKTEKEAVEILWNEYEKAKDLKYVLIDGQPRNLNQVAMIQSSTKFDDRKCVTFNLVCPRNIRLDRALRRYEGEDSLKLALERTDRDILGLHEVLIAFDKYELFNINTSKEQPIDYFRQFVGEPKPRVITGIG